MNEYNDCTIDIKRVKIDIYFMKTSNVYTTIRIVLAPIFLVLFFFPMWTGLCTKLSVFIMIPLLIFAEFTDFLDGHYARKHNEVSDFGKLFDPFADVLLHLTTFFCYAVSGYIPMFFLLLFIYREFGMNFVRLIAAKQGVAIAARKGGKLKTVLYVVAGMFSLFLEMVKRLDLFPTMNTDFWLGFGVGIYIIALLVSYISFIDYLVHFKSVLKADK